MIDYMHQLTSTIQTQSKYPRTSSGIVSFPSLSKLEDHIPKWCASVINNRIEEESDLKKKESILSLLTKELIVTPEIQQLWKKISSLLSLLFLEQKICCSSQSDSIIRNEIVLECRTLIESVAASIQTFSLSSKKHSRSPVESSTSRGEEDQLQVQSFSSDTVRHIIASASSFTLSSLSSFLWVLLSPVSSLPSAVHIEETCSMCIKVSEGSERVSSIYSVVVPLVSDKS
eukprot:gnl/Carplike_NY0171/2628_a3530_436.p1 GENE.gnl/Carplike_NY0171/2628_a3530_436~~gnl/Carplike_NY0171/2628_a3530_436.p1  ORF type:complete len:230 (-),score=45.19 gnl/Carplike_NY0171/2628_a3530_436:648-1337(-)